MDAQGKGLLSILPMPSAKDAPSASSPLARSAKGLANGTTMSRKQALKLMGASAATASLALAGCGGKDQANGSTSGSGGSTSETTVAKGDSTPKQGPEAQKVAAAAKRAMEKYHLKAVLAKVTRGTEEVATLAMGESMTGVPATVDMHFRNGAVAISYLGTVLLQLVDEGKVALDDTIDEWLPDALASEKVTLRMLANCTSGYPDYVTQKSFNDGWVAPPRSALRPCVLSNYPRPTTASLRVIDCLCEDGSSLFEETIYYARPPQSRSSSRSFSYARGMPTVCQRTRTSTN